jgi:triacylglycerol lipase
MFGFGRLASYDYFAHVERALERRLRDAGDEAESFVVDVPPTASVRKRAARLMELVSQTLAADEDSGPVHLIGHSTGGLDARLVASPSARIPVAEGTKTWIDRLASVTTINTPHFGTPLASFFATVSGQRMLYAVSALTYIALTVGAPPLSAASALVVALGRVDRAIGLEIKLIDRTTDALLRVLDDARSREVREYLDAIKADQGAILQLSPEAMDLFQAGVLDRPGVCYQCAASMAPPPSPTRWARNLLSPWSALSSSIFTTLHGLTARLDTNYPCAAQPDAGRQAEAALATAFGKAPGARSNDGVVPIRSQIWGELVWTGLADHLDVLGHFDGQGGHVDWLTSGSSFDARRFDQLCDCIAKGLLASVSA